MYCAIQKRVFIQQYGVYQNKFSPLQSFFIFGITKQPYWALSMSTVK